jgi:hypothetical protein
MPKKKTVQNDRPKRSKLEIVAHALQTFVLIIGILQTIFGETGIGLLIILSWAVITIPSPPSEHLKAALEYAAGLRMLIEAKDHGMLADPTSIEREICRIERSVAYVIGVLAGPA